MNDATLRPGCRMTLHYRLDSGGETLVDTFADTPETFVLGAGELDARLEALLIGLTPGAHRTFDLGPGEAFGMPDAALLQTLPRADFAADAPPQAGETRAFDLPNGDTLIGRVRAVQADAVTVDFNHPLAGCPVMLEVRILDVECP